jgi:hypothetical protein
MKPRVWPLCSNKQAVKRYYSNYYRFLVTILNCAICPPQAYTATHIVRSLLQDADIIRFWNSTAEQRLPYAAVW